MMLSAPAFAQALPRACEMLSALSLPVASVGWTQVWTILLVIATLCVLAVLYTHGWNTSMIRAVEKRTFLLRAELEEKKKAEETLRNSVESLAATLNAMGHGVITLDSSGSIRLMNAQAERMTGWAASDAWGKSIETVYRLKHPETGLPVQPAILAALKGVVPPADVASQHILASRSGREILVSDIAAPIFDKTGHMTGAVIVFNDLGVSAEREIAIRQAQRMEAIKLLAGGVAHEFNNLLAGISGSAEILESRIRPGDRSHDYIKAILSTVERATELTAKLTAFSGSSAPNTRVVNIHDVINDVIALISGAMSPKVEIARQLRAPVPLVSADPLQIQQAIMNLAFNASEAMPNGGRLTFGTEQVALDETFCARSTFRIVPGNYIAISVTDTGVGIPRELLPRLFDPLFTTKRSAGEGIGLGLAAVYGIVKNHKGSIAIESEPGAGTTVRMYFPLAPEAATARPVRAASDRLIRGEGRILLVDDEHLIRMVGTDVLTSLGYRVDTASDGFEAVKFIQENPGKTDLVILDLIMPGMDGRDTLREIRKLDPKVPVMISSGYPLSADEKCELSRSGPLSFVQKPYRAPLLSQLVAEALGRPS